MLKIEISRYAFLFFCRLYRQREIFGERKICIMKKIGCILVCLVALCLLLSGCQNESVTDDAERAKSRVSIAETSLTVADETIAVVTTGYELLHSVCPEVINGKVEMFDSTPSYERWYLGTFGSSEQPLPDAFASLSFDQNTTEEGYLSAFRSALAETLPKGNIPDRFSVSVKSEGYCGDGMTGYYYQYFVPTDTMEGAIRITYTFRFFVTVSGLCSNASIVIKVENNEIKSVELYDLSRFLQYQDFTVDITPITAFADEAIRGEWKVYEDEGKDGVKYALEPIYRVSVSEDALYLEIRTAVTQIIRFCGYGLGSCVHYIKLT